MKFSIIIPVYNVENFVRDCLESVVNQDFPVEEFEILVIDDCSPDASAAIVKSIMIKHLNVRLISHSENKYLGGARNTGINKAQGEWIFFLDSDDKWVNQTVLKHFDSIIEKQPANVEVVRSISYTSLSTKGEKNIIVADRSISYTITIPGESYVAQKGMFYNVWTSCYNVDFLRKNNLFFREHIAFEDSDWSTKVLLLATNIVLLDFPFYGYRMNPESITNLPLLRSFDDNVTSVFALRRILDEMELGIEQQRGINERIKKSLLSFIKISRNYPRRESLKVLARLKNTSLLVPSNYSLSLFEKFQLWALNYCQWGTVTTVRMLIKIKRFFKR